MQEREIVEYENCPVKSQLERHVYMSIDRYKENFVECFKHALSGFEREDRYDICHILKIDPQGKVIDVKLTDLDAKVPEEVHWCLTQESYQMNFSHIMVEPYTQKVYIPISYKI